MESFELLRNHLAMCGIAISQNTTKTHPFNVKNSTVFIVLCVTVSLIVISLNEANTFDECTDIVFRSVSIGTCGIFYGIIVWKTSKLFELVNSLAETVKPSK